MCHCHLPWSKWAEQGHIHWWKWLQLITIVFDWQLLQNSSPENSIQANNKTLGEAGDWWVFFCCMNDEINYLCFRKCHVEEVKLWHFSYCFPGKTVPLALFIHQCSCCMTRTNYGTLTLVVDRVGPRCASPQHVGKCYWKFKNSKTRSSLLTTNWEWNYKLESLIGNQSNYQNSRHPKLKSNSGHF